MQKLGAYGKISVMKSDGKQYPVISATPLGDIIVILRQGEEAHRFTTMEKYLEFLGEARRVEEIQAEQQRNSQIAGTERSSG